MAVILLDLEMNSVYLEQFWLIHLRRLQQYVFYGSHLEFQHGDLPNDPQLENSCTGMLDTTSMCILENLMLLQ